MVVTLRMFFLAEQNDDSSGPNVDLAPGSLHEKKMEAEKRGMGMNDFNGDLRKGGRGGGGVAYRQPGSKEAAPVEVGSYYDKVTTLCHPISHCQLGFVCVSIIFCRLPLFFTYYCLSDSIFSSSSFLVVSTNPPLPSYTPTQIGLPLAVIDRPWLWPIRMGALGRRVLALCTHHPLSTIPIPSSTTLSPLDK